MTRRAASRGGGSTEPPPARPSRRELEAAAGRTVPDVIAPRLELLFCGINPGLYSGATGHHFARPGNRFWPALHLAGFTERLLRPDEEKVLLERGIGITNLVGRATGSAAELEETELHAGSRALVRKLERFEPEWLAVLGIGAYRVGFGKPRASPGRQPERLAGANLWVLPNPSGLNANHQLPDLVRLFRELARAVGGFSSPGSRSRVARRRP
jgi:TDG/mug DNA glycosylase family protein